jgi:hypothetical protein
MQKGYPEEANPVEAGRDAGRVADSEEHSKDPAADPEMTVKTEGTPHE